MLIVMKLVILFAIAGVQFNGQLLLIKAFYDLLSLTFDIFIVALFVQAILSWINPDPYHPGGFMENRTPFFSLGRCRQPLVYHRRGMPGC